MNGTVEDPKAWRDFADRDLRTARILSEREDARDFACIVAFHAHQAAEKYLKGLLALHERREPPKVHNLRLLLTQTVQYVPRLETPELEDAANGLIRSTSPAATLVKSAEASVPSPPAKRPKPLRGLKTSPPPFALICLRETARRPKEIGTGLAYPTFSG